MENLIISYIVKASLAMTLLYGLYVLCFRNDTFNKTKRFYLLFIILFSSLYPFCRFKISTSDTLVAYEAILPQINISGNQIMSNEHSFIMSLTDFLLLILISGIIVLLVRLFIQLTAIINLRLKSGYQSTLNYKIIILDKAVTPFSFFNWIFVPHNSLNEEDKDMEVMMAHEKEHVDQFHSLDILISEVFCILFWWNPITWLLRREIKINLEYLADKGVLEKGIESKQYQYLLLQVIKSSAIIPIVNNFNVSQLKKRITMINKKRTSGLMSFKYLFALPVVAMMLLGNAQNTFSNQIESAVEKSLISESSQQKENVYTMVEQMPKYLGGDNAMMEYIGSNLKYPESAAKENVEGRVVLRFVVAKSGEIKDITVLRSLDSRCDAEAMRVVSEMPKWTPGKQNGKEVDVYYTLPILYKLQKETPKTTSIPN